MSRQTAYWFLCVPGILLPFSSFLPWLADHGLDIPLFVGELFSTRIGMFFGWDVIVSAVVLLLFIWFEHRRHDIKLWWLGILATATVGVSLGLPLFLALRERAAAGPRP